MSQIAADDDWLDDDDAPEAVSVGDFVTLMTRGDVWHVIAIAYGQGYFNDHLLTLSWFTGDENPRRQVKYSSTSVRKLSPMEVIALSAK